MKMDNREIENFLPEYACDDIVNLIEVYNTANWWWQRRRLERMMGQISLTYMQWKYKPTEPTK